MEEKQRYGYCKRQMSEFVHEKTSKLLKKKKRKKKKMENLKRENDLAQTATQSNAIRTKYIKAKIDNAQQNCKWRLCRERNLNGLPHCEQM